MPQYPFTHQYKQIVEALWNSGTPRTLTLADIHRLAGPGAYGNHSKLSYGDWDLVEDDGDNQHRRLTDRGKEFALGTLRIPKTVDDAGKAVTGSASILISQV